MLKKSTKKTKQGQVLTETNEGTNTHANIYEGTSRRAAVH